MHLIKSVIPVLGARAGGWEQEVPEGPWEGIPGALNGAVHFHCLLYIPPPAAVGVAGRGTGGIRGRCGRRKADDSMDSRQAAVLLLVLLLITDWGHAEGPGGQGGDQIFPVS